MAVDYRIGDALSVPRNLSDRRAREKAGDHRPPPRNLVAEQAVRAEAKLRKLLKGAPRTHSERRTIGTVASEATTDFGESLSRRRRAAGTPSKHQGARKSPGRAPGPRLNGAHREPAQASRSARASDRRPSSAHAFVAGDEVAELGPVDHRIHGADEDARQGARHPRALVLATEPRGRAQRQQGVATVESAKFGAHRTECRCHPVSLRRRVQFGEGRVAHNRSTYASSMSGTVQKCAR